MNLQDLEKLTRLIKYYILIATTKAGSGHPSSSLSATDLMTGLLFGGVFRFNPHKPNFPNNDRLIFSKGHASPLLYALWTMAGKITKKQLLTLRQFKSPLEGHPTTVFPYTEATTGSLGQGLSVGLGMALNAKYIDKLSYRTYVLIGDGEMTEGSIWEAVQLAAYYKLDNLVGILDVNRFGQSGPTIYGYNLKKYEDKIKSFGWGTITIDGHNLRQIIDAYRQVLKIKGKPTMIIAKTIKGRGVSFIENKNGWHGKVLNPQQFKKALSELGKVEEGIKGEIAKPRDLKPKLSKFKKFSQLNYPVGEQIATRKAYGYALARIINKFPNIVALDAEVSNSTYSEDFAKIYPKRFFEMYITEQNMVGAALGLSSRSKIPFVSTFSAFLTRAFDQIRMSQYSGANIKFVGSHGGVSIGQDGPSHMGLEDIAMFRSILSSVVFYPSDAISTDKLIEQAASYKGIVYIRTTRAKTPVLYKKSDNFSIGGSKILKQSPKDKVTVVASGITLHEALAAYNELKKQNINIRVIDLYSIKPLDLKTLRRAGRQTQAIITIEDHYPAGGIGEAVASALAGKIKVYQLAVNKIPRSGKPEQLLADCKIDRKAIINTVKKIIKK